MPEATAMRVMRTENNSAQSVKENDVDDKHG